jgi:hypothetical protein
MHIKVYVRAASQEPVRRLYWKRRRSSRGANPHSGNRTIFTWRFATMATLHIKDLSDSTELDREAMRAIVGGARGGSQPWQAIAEVFKDRRIVDYPPGVKPRNAAPPARK